MSSEERTTSSTASSRGGTGASGRGVCIWLTGRSGSGKSTLTAALLPLLEERGRTVSILDVVPHLQKVWCERTSEPKLLRKAYVAGEVARHGGIAICVTVSARRQTREAAREIVGSDRFLEVFVDAPGDVTAARKAERNRKPSLAKRAKRWARRTLARVRGGATSSFEAPLSPDLTVDTIGQTPAGAADALLELLVQRGFVSDRVGETAG